MSCSRDCNFNQFKEYMPNELIQRSKYKKYIYNFRSRLYAPCYYRVHFKERV